MTYMYQAALTEFLERWYDQRMSEAGHDCSFGTGFEFRPVRISVIGVVYSALNLEKTGVCGAVYIILCTIKNP